MIVELSAVLPVLIVGLVLLACICARGDSRLRD
jgi:hypothetical protein